MRKVKVIEFWYYGEQLTRAEVDRRELMRDPLLTVCTERLRLGVRIKACSFNCECRRCGEWRAELADKATKKDDTALPHIVNYQTASRIAGETLSKELRGQ